MQTKNSAVFVGLFILFQAFLPVFAARPTVTIKAVPTTINLGGSSTLTWTSSNAVSASINQGIGGVPLNGLRSVSPTVTTTYTITVKNASNVKATASAKVTVKPALPIVTFSASPGSLSQGQNSTLSWTTSNATSASINQGIGSVALNGSKTVTPTATTTYTITATGSGGTVTATVTVTVSLAPPSVVFSAAPTTIDAGQSSTLSWTTSNATSASIDQGIGAVSTSGSITVRPVQTTIYTITVAGSGGSATGYAQVTVASKPVITFSVTPKIIPSGASATLTWDCVNSTSASIDNDIGDVPLNGSRSVSPVKTTTYTITASGSGDTVTAKAMVVVGGNRQGVLFVNNDLGANVRVLDADTGDILNTIAIPATNIRLWGAESDPSGSFVYVANNGALKIHQIDPLTMSLRGEVGIEGYTKFLAAAPDGRYLYATISNGYYYNQWVSPLSIISTYKNDMDKIKTLFIPGDRASGLAVAADSSRVYVSLGTEDKVVVLNAATLQQSLTYDMDISDDLLDEYEVLSPGEMAVSPNKHELYVLNYNGLAVFDTNNGTLIKNIAVFGNYIKVSPDGGKIYVMDDYSGLSVIEAAGLTSIKSYLPIGQNPSQIKCLGLAVHPDGSRLYVIKEKIYVVETEAYSGVSTMVAGNSSWYYGNFVSYMPWTISGKVTQDGSGLASVKMFLDGEGIARSFTTAADGRYAFAAKEGGEYKVTPEFQALIFTPENLTLTVNGHLTDQDFVVSGIVQPPTVTLTSSSTWVKQYESFTLTWSSTGADYVTLEMATSDHLPPSGSRIFALQSTSTIWAVAHNRGGTASANVKVYVSSSDPPTASISASPTSILLGSSSTLTWSSTKAATVTIDNGIGSVAANGNLTVTPAATITYTITVTGSQGYQVTTSATVEVSQYDISAVLTGTVTDYATSQPLADVTISALDAAGVPQTALSDATGKYTISNLRVGAITVSFTKSGYDLYQQIINIPSNTTFDLATQLHLTQIGATLRGFVKDGQTNLPIAGATVTAVFSGGSLSATSGADGAYALVGIPLNTTAVVTASADGFRNLTISQIFTQNAVIIYNFILYNNSVLAIVNGKITNSKTLLPEAGVKVTHEDSNVSKTTAADGTFVFENIPFGEQSFNLEKTDFIEETYICTIDSTPFTTDLIKPSREGGQISIGQNISGVIQDAVSQRPLSGAIVRVPGLDLEAETNADGNYQFTSLPIGNYPIMVIATNHMALNFMASVDIDETNRADFALIPLANGLIKGTVTDAATGEPVPEASIEIEGSAMLAATSEGDGTYKMVGVPPGIYKVLVMHAEYMDALVENIDVRDLSPTTIDLQLSRRPVTGALEGRILNNATGNPVSGASVTISGTAITATTDADGNYRLTNVPAGLNDIIVSAPGYPDSSRIRAVIADKDLSSPSTTSSDIRIDINNSTANEVVTAIITANEGGDIITQDSRFLLHIFPGTLSADARITLKDASDGPDVPIGSDLPLDPTLGIEGVKAASVMTQIEIAPVNSGDPAPILNGLAVFAARYAQKDTDAFQLDENTAFMYSWSGSYFTALDPRPYEFIVDKINNIVYSTMDFSRSIIGSTVQFNKRISLTSNPEKSGKIDINPTEIIIKIIGKSIKNTIFPPKPNVRIFDKNELNCVSEATPEQKPNPNALPLLVIHGFDPLTLFGLDKKVTNPNNVERYQLMLEDIVDATNGVYRPVFVSYNTEAKIPSIAQSLAENILGEYRDQNISFKGLAADPNDPASGTFPYLDTFGFSMGGLVSRTFIYFNRLNRVHNMTMIGTPNHGVFNCLKYLFENDPLFGGALCILKPLNFGASDMLDYDDNNPIDGNKQNPFLFRLNSPIFSPAVTPRGDMNLFAGTDENAWWGLTNLFIASPHDSLVTVKSVYCRPTNSTLESKLSLLKVQKPLSEKYEHTKIFSHANIGTKDKRINDFSEELAKGFSDWTVERVYNENSMDNAFIKPTKDVGGYCKSKVKVEYNVWVPDAERQARDFDRVVLVIYHKDGNDHWHISEPKGGENGADVNGNVVGAKVEDIKGNSLTNSVGARILFATVNFEPNPPKGATGYDPEKDIVDTISLVIPLKPGKMTVPLDPTKAHFRTPNLNE